MKRSITNTKTQTSPPLNNHPEGGLLMPPPKPLLRQRPHHTLTRVRTRDHH
nr:MAG TPA: hypothetical protein [Caudoviricetes sp.]